MVSLTSDSAAVSVPSSVIVPAGETAASFAVQGDAPGVSVIRAEASLPGFETSYARVRVLEAASGLRIAVESGAGQAGVPGEPLPEPVVIRVTDDGRVPYSGVPLEVVPSGDGAATVEPAATGPDGRARIAWTAASSGPNVLRISILDFRHRDDRPGRRRRARARLLGDRSRQRRELRVRRRRSRLARLDIRGESLGAQRSGARSAAAAGAGRRRGVRQRRTGAAAVRLAGADQLVTAVRPGGRERLGRRSTGPLAAASQPRSP